MTNKSLFIYLDKLLKISESVEPEAKSALKLLEMEATTYTNEEIKKFILKFDFNKLHQRFYVD